jgi:hypothetical protein
MYRNFNKTVPLLFAAFFVACASLIYPGSLLAVKLCAPFNSSWVLLKSQGATDAAGGDEMFPGRREVAFSPSNSSGSLYRLGYIKNKT